MSTIQFHVEWESGGSARGPELRATWARLHIDVAGQCVTQVEDKRTGSVRDAIYGPMYPLAEWIAANWWSLLYEIASPLRIAGDGYLRRHSLSSASEGFALPALRLQPEGRRVELVWEPRESPWARLRFLGGGRAYIDRMEVADALRIFVSSVVERLRDQGSADSFLAEEWNSLEATDAQERAFCRIAGSLGWDPYALSDSRIRAVIKTAQLLPAAIRDEAFSALEATNLVAQGKAVHDFIDAVSKSDSRLDALEALRRKSKVPTSSQSPWEQGYEFARQLRRTIASRERVRSVDDLGILLAVDRKVWKQAIVTGADKLKFLDALVGSTKAGAPRFALHPQHEASRVFVLCRALFEYLYDTQASAWIVAPIYSERQKRNRAFAAEFLAPAEEIRHDIKGAATVTAEQVGELAEKFGTSEYVIAHQIENHRLTRIAGWTF